MEFPNYEISGASSALRYALLLALAFPVAAQAAEYPPSDHAGADLTLANGDVIWGTHANVGTFTIPAGAAVTVKPYDGSNRIGSWTSETGTLVVSAHRIRIDGKLDANGAGFTGGAGGGGACGSSGAVNPGNGGVARYLTGISGESLTASKGTRSWCGSTIWFWGCQFGGGGTGTHGDGLDGGDFDGVAPADWAAACGGYASGRGVGFNEDSSTDESVLIGSGGSGARGGNASGGGQGSFATVYFGGYGGAAGGSGGGMISLTASQSFTFGPTAAITADGRMGLGRTEAPTTGEGAHGRDAIEAIPTSSGSVNSTNWAITGGAGSGGGILLKCTAADGLNMAPTAVVKSLGGGELVQNGGTVKLFYVASEYMTTLPSIYAGHRLISTIPSSAVTNSASTENWADYH